MKNEYPCSVLMSVKPQWLELMHQGKKTIEVRKTIPNFEYLDTPFCVHFYCSRPDMRMISALKDGDDNYGEIYHGKFVPIKTYDISAGTWIFGKWGHIVGSATCVGYESLNNLFEGEPTYHLPTSGDSCLAYEQLEEYGKGKRLWGWRLTEFQWEGDIISDYKVPPRQLEDYGAKHAPMSWQYVYEKDMKY